MERSSDFPRAWCEACGQHEACAAVGATRPEYPRCRAPLRDVDVGRTEALLAHLATTATSRDDAVRAMERALLDHFGIDRARFSEILEPSFSCDARGEHLYRFSYAFPGFRNDPASAGAALVALTSPFGEAAADTCRALLRAARSPAVEQPLFGYADDGAGAHRVKLYLQFVKGASDAAFDLIAKMIGRTPGEELGRSGALHLAGFDLGARGLASVKLYLEHASIATEGFDRTLGHFPIVAALAARGVRELKNVLVIHRIDGLRAILGPAEIDFALADNDLLWRDVRALPPIESLLAACPSVGALEASFRIAVRRISVSSDATKLNAYYVLTEREAGAMARDEARSDRIET